MGYWGVDIFVFLSAYGLYFFFQKQGYSISQFYKRRVFRLLPAYYFVLFCIFFIDVFFEEKSNPFLLLFQEVSMLVFFSLFCIGLSSYGIYQVFFYCIFYFLYYTINGSC